MINCSIVAASEELQKKQSIFTFRGTVKKIVAPFQMLQVNIKVSSSLFYITGLRLKMVVKKLNKRHLFACCMPNTFLYSWIKLFY